MGVPPFVSHIASLNQERTRGKDGALKIQTGKEATAKSAGALSLEQGYSRKTEIMGRVRQGQRLLPNCCMKTRATFSGRIRRVWMKRDRSPPAQNSMMR